MALTTLVTLATPSVTPPNPSSFFSTPPSPGLATTLPFPVLPTSLVPPETDFVSLAKQRGCAGRA